MTHYTHLWVLPYHDFLRSQGKLTKGQKKVKIGKDEADYNGELADNGACCGAGIAILENGNKYEGTWLNDQLHGICKFSAQA